MTSDYNNIHTASDCDDRTDLRRLDGHESWRGVYALNHVDTEFDAGASDAGGRIARVAAGAGGDGADARLGVLGSR